jgi:hypothetical protein
MLFLGRINGEIWVFLGKFIISVLAREWLSQRCRSLCIVRCPDFLFSFFSFKDSFLHQASHVEIGSSHFPIFFVYQYVVGMYIARYVGHLGALLPEDPLGSAIEYLLEQDRELPADSRLASGYE